MFISPAFAQAGSAPGGGFMEFLPLVLILVVFYFLLIRPQQKRAKEHKAMVAAVRRGDKVVTGGGIMGKVVKVESAEEVVVEIADGIRVNIVTSTLSDVRSKGEPAADNDK